MLLSIKEWDRLTRSIRKKHKYILFYPLAEINEESKGYVNQLSWLLDMPVIQIKYENRHSALSPSDFVRYIKGAEYVVTDSFHGVVFSMLYHKPISYWQSCDVMQQTISRLKTLLDLAEIDLDFTKHIMPFPPIKWERFDANVQNKRAESFKYLKQIIQNGNNE